MAPDTADVDPLTTELFNRSRGVVELEPAQVEAWVSGLFEVWESDDDTLRFLAHCESETGPVAALLCAAIAELADEPVRSQAAATAGRLAEAMPSQGEHIGSACANAAWLVRAPFGRSVMIGFGPEGASDDDCDHTLLAEIGEDGALVDLKLGGPPRDLLPDTTTPEAAHLAVAPIDIPTAADEIASAWALAAEELQDYDESVGPNERLARHRLAAISSRPLPPLRFREAALDPYRGMSVEEFLDANRAARTTLRAALGDLEPAQERLPAHDGWVAVIRASVSGASASEAEALHHLEWADWLGAGIEMWRRGPHTPVDGQALVDFVNRCAEVTTTISKRDRAYTAQAFDIALDHLGDYGAVADGRLTEDGHRSLPGAMAAAWSPQPDQ